MMMPPLLILFAVVMLFILIIANFVVASRRKPNTSPAKPIEMDWDAIQDEIVQSALAKPNKIEAIKRYRQLTGQGLKESKDAIDYALLHPDEHGAKKKKATYNEQDAGIRDLILEGRLDEAVEIYQKFAGVDSYTARDAVDTIARDLSKHYAPPADPSSRK